VVSIANPASQGNIGTEVDRSRQAIGFRPATRAISEQNRYRYRLFLLQDCLLFPIRKLY
jgi:hypothetical protein